MRAAVVVLLIAVLVVAALWLAWLVIYRPNRCPVLGCNQPFRRGQRFCAKCGHSLLPEEKR